MAEGDALDQKCMDYRASIAWMQSPPDHQSHMCLHGELSKMIATFHQRIITVEIKTDETHPDRPIKIKQRAFEAFYKRTSTCHHLTRLIVIERSLLNGNGLRWTVSSEPFINSIGRLCPNTL